MIALPHLSSQLAVDVLDARSLPAAFGALGVGAVMFAETGLAGALGVPVRTFTVWQVAGGLLRSIGLTLAGYALGSSVPDIDRYLLPLVALVSLIPLAADVLRSRRTRPRPPAAS
jgi:hypothetical protein